MAGWGRHLSRLELYLALSAFVRLFEEVQVSTNSCPSPPSISSSKLRTYVLLETFPDQFDLTDHLSTLHLLNLYKLRLCLFFA